MAVWLAGLLSRACGHLEVHVRGMLRRGHMVLVLPQGVRPARDHDQPARTTLYVVLVNPRGKLPIQLTCPWA